jgi:hypothetical protein
VDTWAYEWVKNTINNQLDKEDLNNQIMNDLRTNFYAYTEERDQMEFSSRAKKFGVVLVGADVIPGSMESERVEYRRSR